MACAAQSASMARIALRVAGHLQQLERRRHAHAHVVFLVARRGDRVDARRVAEDLVLGDQRGGRVLGDHVAVVEAAVRGEERRQLDSEAGQHAKGAALADAADLGEAHGRQVEGQGERLAVEVAGRDDVARIREDERVVGDRLDLDGDLAQPAQASRQAPCTWGMQRIE
jgi:hypothetical protein